MKYPAEHAPLPQVDHHGGRIIEAVKLVTVTWASDDPVFVGRLNDFGAMITSTPWWSATTSEYCVQPKGAPCVGPGRDGGQVSIAEPPAGHHEDSSQGKPSTIQELVKRKVADHVLPDPTDDTLYAIYLPEGVSVDRDGKQSCAGFSAYHDTIVLKNADGQAVVAAYAVMPRCGDEASTTTAASHELVEAATDPDVAHGVLSYYLRDSAWAAFGGELADLCELTGAGSPFVESGYAVHRSWSNASARGGHDPCVPSRPASLYFNTAPRAGRIVLDSAGDTTTVVLDAFSSAPTSDWALSVLDLQGSALSFAFDKTAVNNGDHVRLTVTAMKNVPIEGAIFAIVSRQERTSHFWWVDVHRREEM